METVSRAILRTAVCLVALAAAVPAAGGGLTFFALYNLPLPYDAEQLRQSGPPAPLQPHEVLIEEYVLSRSGRVIQSAAVYPGALNAFIGDVPDTLAVTDANGFFSLVVDRERHTHVAAGCLVRKRGQDAGLETISGTVVLPRAEVAQAERTLRLDVPRRVRRCEWPIEGPPDGTIFPQ